MVAYDDDEALSPVPMLSAPPTAAPISESRRQALRDIELKVVKYQDDLEACRKKGDSSVSDEAIAKVRSWGSDDHTHANAFYAIK